MSVSRVLRVAIALGLLGVIVDLGFRSSHNTHFVLWFGLATAILSPLAFSLIGSLFENRNSDLINKLSRVPEIDRLIASAQTETERLRLLQEERATLSELVAAEARRLALVSRRESLERDGVQLMLELQNIDAELAASGALPADSPASRAIREVGERIRARDKGDLVLRVRGRFYSIDRDIVKALPLGAGEILLAMARVIDRLSAPRLRSN